MRVFTSSRLHVFTSSSRLHVFASSRLHVASSRVFILRLHASSCALARAWGCVFTSSPPSVEIAQIFNHHPLLTKQARNRAHLNLPRICERQKALWPVNNESKFKFNNKYLNIINDTWNKTNIVTISPLGEQHSRMAIHSPMIFIPWPP